MKCSTHSYAANQIRMKGSLIKLSRSLMPIVLLNIIKHLRDKSFETVLINLKLMYNFATLSESTLLTLGTKIPQKKLLREINMALKRLLKHVSFHISMSRHSAKWPQMPSVTSPAGAGPSQRGRCTHAV